MEAVRFLKRTQFEHELKLCQESPMYAECMRNLGLQEFKLQIASESHRYDLLKTSCFSYATLNPLNRMFRLNTAQNMDAWEGKVDKLIETGTYIILVNKNTQQIVGGTGFIDLCEVFQTPIRFPQMQRIMQIIKKTKKLFWNNNKNNSKYKQLSEIMQ
eukprot:171299_1